MLYECILLSGSYCYSLKVHAFELSDSLDCVDYTIKFQKNDFKLLIVHTGNFSTKNTHTEGPPTTLGGTLVDRAEHQMTDADS